jgi:hypothetical protein
MKALTFDSDYIPTGPLRLASGPHDSEGLGRERFWDQSEAEREANLPTMTRLLKSWYAEGDRMFANGWFAEHSRLMRARRKTP